MVASNFDSSPARQGAAARIAQIVDAATKIIVQTGCLPLSMKQVGEVIGVSRALVYTYFPDGGALAAAVLADHLAALERAGVEQASSTGTLAERARACADRYVRHVAAHGPVLHIILRDRDQLVLHRDALALRQRIARRLARLARAELSIDGREALALFELLLTIPEEAGRLAFDGLIDLADARHTCARLIESSLNAIRPTGDGPA